MQKTQHWQTDIEKQPDHQTQRIENSNKRNKDAKQCTLISHAWIHNGLLETNIPSKTAPTQQRHAQEQQNENRIVIRFTPSKHVDPNAHQSKWTSQIEKKN